MTLKITLKADDTAEVMLYGQIGSSFWDDGISARDFRDQVKAIKVRVLNLRINSPGGSVFEGAAMLNTLDDWKAQGKTIEVDVDGVAASAASFVAMAGNTIRMASNGLLMIHDPVAGVQGGAEDLRRTASLLDGVKEQILDAYSRRPKTSREALASAMKAETWYTAKEAVAAGLADSVGPRVQVTNFVGPAAVLAKFGYRNTPPLPLVEAAAVEETRKRREIAARLTA